MRKDFIQPNIAKELVGDNDAVVGAVKFLSCEHKDKTLFGGLSNRNMGDISKDDGGWHMAVGTLIFIPCKKFVWDNETHGKCGWSIEDLLRQGLHPKFWKEQK